MSLSTIKPLLSLVTSTAVRKCINKPLYQPHALVSTTSHLWAVPMKREKLCPRMELSTIQPEPALSPELTQAGGEDTRPLVVLLGWLLAKPRHLNKYANLYLSKGFDVLSLQTRPADMLIPKRTQQLMERLLKLLDQPHMEHKPILVHGFSVGAYVFGEMLAKLRDDAQRWQGVRHRMTGQIFDSPVDFDNVPNGFSNATMPTQWAVNAMEKAIQGYLKMMHNVVTRHYIYSSDAFKQNDLRLPSIFLYSRADPIGVDHRIEEVMAKWRAEGIQVTGRCWESSPHVSHFHRHPDEYVDAVLGFLDALQIEKHAEKVKATKATLSDRLKESPVVTDLHQKQDAL